MLVVRMSIIKEDKSVTLWQHLMERHVLRLLWKSKDLAPIYWKKKIGMAAIQYQKSLQWLFLRYKSIVNLGELVAREKCTIMR